MELIYNQEPKVLIVDDTPENLEIAGKILEKNHYDIYVADSGELALELIEKVEFDLILLDVMMPNMDGFEACKLIKVNEEYANVPIIFVTARVDDESVIKGFEYGAVDYVRKPFNFKELLARVKMHIELKKTREELEEKNKSLEEANKKLKIIATTDPLTKLLNRRSILEKLDYAKVRYERNKEKFSVIICDIDYFKKVNDTYGHECGDCVLENISKTLRCGVRSQDYVARWGGEEFLILLPETDLDGAAILAEKLRVAIQENTIKYNDLEVKVTMTFGLNVYSEEQTLNEVVSNADKALYIGKENGRNCVVRGNMNKIQVI